MRMKRLALTSVAMAALLVAPAARLAAQATGTPQVRMSWQDFISGPDGAKRLASLQKAIDKMKSLDNSPPTSADFRRSWQYWANIHGYYGSTSPDGTVEAQIQYLNDNGLSQYVPYYQGIVDQTAPDSIATTVWATCQHSEPGNQALNFFGWHRMYLYYYERVLRWASGDDTLRLPYWDYTDVNQLALPADFRTTSATLYDQKRDPGINGGTSTLSAKSTDINDQLPKTDYFKYEKWIEGNIHGYVHCTVGPTCPVAHMGDVPVAGNDPIFYSHHANIDRLWACWQNLHPLPAGTWQDQKFSFPDENGNLQTRMVKEFFDSVPLGYVYENTKDCARPTTSTASFVASASAPAAKGRKMAKIAAIQSLAVDQPSKSFDLKVPKTKLLGAQKDLSQPGTVELVLRDVTAASPPGTLFDVYLAKQENPAERQLVGTISWFGTFRHHHHAGQTKPGAGAEKRTLEFDVTDELRALGGDAAGLTVVIEASTGRTPADPAQADAERKSAASAFRAAAKLKIGSIELHAPAAVAPKAPAKPKK